MSSLEIEILLKILECKVKKTEFINIQSYENAANARDEEREYELQLLELNGISLNLESEHLHIERKIRMNEYFGNNFGIEYPNNMSRDRSRNFLRQIKLEKLGI